MHNSLFLCSSVNSTLNFTNETCTFDGLERLAELGYEVGWLWYDVLALVLYTLVFLTATFIID